MYFLFYHHLVAFIFKPLEQNKIGKEIGKNLLNQKNS